MRRYTVKDPKDGTVLGHFQADDSATPDELNSFAEQALAHFQAKRVSELSRPNVQRKIRCQVCPEQPGTWFDLAAEAETFHAHMQKHNEELNLGEDIE